MSVFKRYAPVDLSARLTLNEQVTSVGWFLWAYAVIVGGPSVLSILESVFIDHQLVAALQWIVEGFNRLLSVLDSVFAPLFRPMLSWINRLLDWNLALQPQWKALFALGMLLVSAISRSLWLGGNRIAGVVFLFYSGFFILVGSVLAGLAPPTTWWAQGLAAAMPVFLTVVAWAVFTAIMERDLGTLRNGSIASLICFAVLFAIASVVSFVPGVKGSAGALCLGAAVLLASALLVKIGADEDDDTATRAGLTTLGGFGAAAIILFADLILRWTGAAA
jgi:uncharacterized membrane protein